jgi:hypothetical protein
MTASASAGLDHIDNNILLLRGERVILDMHLARLYGVTTRRLNEQVKRNRRRFPADFVFQLTDQDIKHLMSQNATSSLSSGEWGGRRKRPLAFTEHGAVMAASVLSSDQALVVSVYVVRAFIRMRDALGVHKELAAKLAELERRTATLALKHDELSKSTHTQFRQVIEALRQLMMPIPTQSAKRPIGFVTPKD